MLGGSPLERPERYAQASPRALLPIGVPQAVVASSMLATEPAVAYRNAGRAAGDDVTLSGTELTGNAELVAMRPGPSPGHRARDLILQLVPPKVGRHRYLP